MRSRGYVAADAGPFTCCELGAPAVSDPTRKATVDRRARDDGGERRQTHGIARIRNVDRTVLSKFASVRLLCTIASVLAAVPATALASSSGTLGSLKIPTVDPAPPLDPIVPTGAWAGARAVPLLWDVINQRAASEPSTALIATDGQFLYVRFDVRQRETLLAQQQTNNVGDGTDDEVWIDLWPSGSSGFYYQFAATSLGTHFQYSSENTAYEPTWESFGARSPGGYTVTMKIPLRIIRGSSAAHSWRAQFVRVVRSTGERQIWSYGRKQTNADDVAYAGSVTGLASAAVSRPQPRLGVYGLGAVSSPRSGLTTSRVGADVSVPITATASFYSTLHPDYSNLEIDQQTISPTAYVRSYQETRPFFVSVG
jgi:hypothetical protein